MDNERLDTNPSSNHTGKRVSKERRAQVEELLRSGVPILDVAKTVRMSPNNVMAIKRDMPETTGLKDEFKATTVRNLKAFVQRASQKLVDELDSLHVSQIPIAMGISIDKINALQDQPQAVVEHRFSISHDALDKLLKAKGQGVRVDDKGVIDLEVAQPKPESTQNFLDWAKDPKDFLNKTVVPDYPSHESPIPDVRPPPPPSNHEDEGEE
jgi:hypothetical protein